MDVETPFNHLFAYRYLCLVQYTSCHHTKPLHTDVAIYRTYTPDSSHVGLPLNRHRSNISIVTIQRQKDDQWLIYRAHMETDFTKCFAIQDQMRRSLTGK